MRAAGHGRCPRAIGTRYGLRRREPSGSAEVDDSNPYFTFDRQQVHCLFALRSRLRRSAGYLRADDRRAEASSRKSQRARTKPFLDSECVSCGACVEACPTRRAEREIGACSRRCRMRSLRLPARIAVLDVLSEPKLKGDQLVRMAPDKDGNANHGHACVKGRFAFGYATHADRVTTPMIRKTIDDPWRSVSWDEAIEYAAHGSVASKRRYGSDAIGGITSSRCYQRRDVPGAEVRSRSVRQQQRGYVRAGMPFTDRLRAEEHIRRVCRHAGLRFRHEGRRHYRVGANPTDAPPCFRVRRSNGVCGRARSSLSPIRGRSTSCARRRSRPTTI